MDDRDRTAPIALPRNAPIAQLVIDLALALRAAVQLRGLEALGRLLLCFRDGQAVEEARIDEPSLAVERRLADDEARRIDALRADHRRRAETIASRKVQIALVMRRAAEDRARAVIHQDEIGDIDRQRPIGIEGMNDAQPRVIALLLRRLDRRDRGADMAAFLREGGERRVARSRFARERVIGRERHEFRAEQSVRPRGEHLDLAGRIAGQSEADQQPLRAADPIALHQPHLLRPAVERVERGEQIVGVCADAQEPLGQLALLDQRAGAPAAPVDHLLIGEHGVIDRVPIDLGLLAIDEAAGEKVEEQLLLVLVIGRVASGDLARPVERQPHGFELRPHAGDIGVGPGRPDARRSARRRSRPAGRRRPSPSDAARRSPWRACSGR